MRKEKHFRYHNSTKVDILTNAFGFHKFDVATIYDDIKFVWKGTWCVKVRLIRNDAIRPCPTKYIRLHR